MAPGAASRGIARQHQHSLSVTGTSPKRDLNASLDAPASHKIIVKLHFLIKPPLSWVILKSVQKLSPILFTSARRDECTSSCQAGLLQREVWQEQGQCRQGAAAALLPWPGKGWGQPGPAAQLLTSALPVTPLKVSLAKQWATSSNPTVNTDVETEASKTPESKGF